MIDVVRHLSPRLSELVGRASRSLVISSPYVSQEGTALVTRHMSPEFLQSGTLWFLTDLSPINVCQSATDPSAILTLASGMVTARIRHLPRLHAKVYVADNATAIVTSGNLTAGGLFRNHEYGIEVHDQRLVERIRADLVEYGDLGAVLSIEQLQAYCAGIASLRTEFAAREVRAKSRLLPRIRQIEDQLLRLRLAGGPPHTVFARTIDYLLRRHGPMTTDALHPLIEAIHPDLCDNTVDRIIDGKRFGKKWKHAVRTAQQQLKKKGVISYDGTRWYLA